MKSKYETVVLPQLDQVQNWIRDGMTEQQVAKRLGIAYSTFRVYRDKYPALSAVLKKTKEVVDAEVVGALYKRAIGYDVTEYEEVYDGAGNLVSRKKKIRHIPPDPTSMNLWLTHRQKAAWGAVIEATDDNTGGVIILAERNILEEPKDEG